MQKQKEIMKHINPCMLISQPIEGTLHSTKATAATATAMAAPPKVLADAAPLYGATVGL